MLIWKNILPGIYIIYKYIQSRGFLYTNNENKTKIVNIEIVSIQSRYCCRCITVHTHTCKCVFFRRSVVVIFKILCHTILTWNLEYQSVIHWKQIGRKYKGLFNKTIGMKIERMFTAVEYSTFGIFLNFFFLGGYFLKNKYRH